MIFWYLVLPAGWLIQQLQLLDRKCDSKLRSILVHQHTLWGVHSVVIFCCESPDPIQYCCVFDFLGSRCPYLRLLSFCVIRVDPTLILFISRFSKCILTILNQDSMHTPYLSSTQHTGWGYASLPKPSWHQKLAYKPPNSTKISHIVFQEYDYRDEQKFCSMVGWFTECDYHLSYRYKKLRSWIGRSSFCETFAGRGMDLEMNLFLD